MTLALLLACSPELQTDTPEPVVLETWVEDKKVAAGEPVVLHVQLKTEKGWTAEPELGLPAELGAELVDSQPGDWTFELSGEPGSYLIPSTTVQIAGPEGQQSQLSSDPIYVDLGIEGPSSDLLPPEALLEPTEEEESRTLLVLVLVGGVLLLVGGLAALVLAPMIRRARPQALPTPRPDEEALKSWLLVLEQKLPMDERARQLSLILRTYVQASTGAAALAATTPELLTDLRLLPRWRARLDDLEHLLQATDRLKYAGGSCSDELFERLDADFRLLVEQTRPWRDERGQAA